MAARRVTKSAVDWAAFAERVPATQKTAFRALKARHDGYMGLVFRHPENMPAIDFAYYRSRLASPALADEMEKGMKALKIPYPQDNANVKAELDAKQKAAEEKAQEVVKDLQHYVEDKKQLLARLDSIPPLEELPLDAYYNYFPEQSLVVENSEDATIFPHTAEWQIENNPDIPNHHDFSATKAYLKSSLGKFVPKY